MKKCTVCKTIKNESEYYKNCRSNDGHQKHCKDCHKVMERKWNKLNIESIRKRARVNARRYRKENPIKYKEANKKSFTKNRSKYLENRRIVEKKGLKYLITMVGNVSVVVSLIIIFYLLTIKTAMAQFIVSKKE